MVNGAGLAMATMDIIQLLGGGTCQFFSQCLNMLKTDVSIILKDPHVKAILINIFGGIVCLAQGIAKAAYKKVTIA